MLYAVLVGPEEGSALHKGDETRLTYAKLIALEVGTNKHRNNFLARHMSYSLNSSKGDHYIGDDYRG